MTKTCRQCRTVGPVAEFVGRAKCARCLDINRRAASRYRSRVRGAPEAVQRGAGDHEYAAMFHGMPLSVLRQWHADTRGECHTCGDAVLPPMTGNTQGVSYIDHDHACCPGVSGCPECVRGILCRSCNVGFGYIERAIAQGVLVPDPACLLAEYLRRRPFAAT